MAQYSFLKEANLYLVKDNARYLIDISNVSFNQTFTEETYKVQNLHTSDIFEGSVIVQANPANFSFTCFVLKEVDHKVVFNSLIDIFTFDLYVQTRQDTFKLEKFQEKLQSFLE
jgi:peroxiredoxin